VRRGAAGSHRSLVGVELALNLPHHHAQDRALALDGFAQTFELLGVGIATGLVAQRLALLRIGLLQRDASSLGSGVSVGGAGTASGFSTCVVVSAGSGGGG